MKKDKSKLMFKYEADLTTIVKEYLESIPNARFDKMSDRYHPGISDFIGCYKGYLVAIELKAEYGEPTMHQIKYLADIIQSGGKALLAYTLQQVIDFIGQIV
jgi:penicillin-binding protein-related factor A (putative recombinase)